MMAYPGSSVSLKRVYQKQINNKTEYFILATGDIVPIEGVT